MKEPVSLFDTVDEETERMALAEAEAELEAGKGIPHEVVGPWLLKLADGDDAPHPTSVDR